MTVELHPDDVHNRTLIEHVHPRSWTNPRPSGRYNLVVIGAGTAGLVAAAGAAGLGAKVALIERNLMGGDCLNFGCVPSKSLIRAARAAHAVRNAGEFGIRVEAEPVVDFPALMERMRRQRASIAPHDGAERFTRLGVDVFLGHARFVADDAVEVDGQRLSFSRAAIATGARAARLPVPGLDEVGCLTNESVFSLTELPRRLAVIGGGPIGCELAQAFARFGTDVTLIEAASRILAREDPDAATVVTRALDRDGVTIRAGSTLEKVGAAIGGEGPSGGKTLWLRGEGGEHELTVDEILVGVGRTPNVDGLELDRVGVAHDERGVTVDDRLRTTNPRIFAAGDVCSPYKFTHAADAMARIVLQNALFFGRKRASALVIPWCTYTDPEIAHVGLYESQAREAGHDVETLTVELADVDRALLDGETEGFARVHHAKGSGRILGATIVASHAGEMIGELALAMTTGADLGALARTIHPYPTQVEALKRLGDAFMRSKLTPRVQGWFERFLAWRR
ncbi:MAG: mercuric reductase [Planctomycetota bacterium]|jgi:pyruvate/2-oxoglutarate dehydrogenase complex dihydrolipoamide dehydrogenase (E3) component